MNLKSLYGYKSIYVVHTYICVFVVDGVVILFRIVNALAPAILSVRGMRNGRIQYKYMRRGELLQPRKKT